MRQDFSFTNEELSRKGIVAVCRDTYMHPKLICPLSSRQVKYLKFSVDDACISLWNAIIFLCAPFFFIFHDLFVFRNRIFCWRIAYQRLLSHF